MVLERSAKLVPAAVGWVASEWGTEATLTEVQGLRVDLEQHVHAGLLEQQLGETLENCVCVHTDQDPREKMVE